MISHTKKNICMALFAFDIGGSEKLGLSLIQSYLDRGHKVVCVGTRRGEGPISDILQEMNVPYLALDLESLDPVRKWFRRRSLARWMKLHRVDSVHAQHFCVLSDLRPAIRRLGLEKVLVTEHSANYLRNDPDYMRVTRSVSDCSSDIVAINPVVRSALAELLEVPEAEISLIENGIDTDYFSPLMDASPDDSDNVKVLWVGRHHPDKDVLNGIEAFAVAARGSQQTMSLTVVGDGEQFSAANDLVKALGIDSQVRFAGEQRGVAKYYREADIFLISSATEGTPLALLEAMSSGLPVVATAVGGIPAVVTKNIGRLAPPKDPAVLGHELGLLADDENLRIQMGKSARSLVVESFSGRKMQAEYIRVLEG